MKYLPALFMLIFFKQAATAQYKAVVPYQDKWVIRVSPLGLIDVFDGNLTAGTAYAVNKRFTLSADLSYIFYSAYIRGKKSVSGYIFKPGIRYYLSDKRKIFAESAVFYKRGGYKITDWLDEDCVNGVPAYRQLTTFTVRKQVVGLNLQAGFQKSLIKNNLLRMEIYAGLNVRYKWQDIKNNPTACYQSDDLFNESVNTPNGFSAGVPHGLRMVYVLR